ncbi:isoaspartyl peptidase/L-asparaginase, partial [Brucella anthropi]
MPCYDVPATHRHGKGCLHVILLPFRRRACGAISGICGPRNPVLAARAVMEQTEHVFFAGEGAKRFCEAAGLEMMAPEWFS